MRCDAMRLWEHTVLQQAVRRLLCSMFRIMELQINNGTSEAKYRYSSRIMSTSTTVH